jgi:hypothetical protein
MSEYKKTALTLAIIVISALSALFLPDAARAELGCPDGWACGELKITRLDAVSGNQGFWFERDYRTGSGVSLKAAVMEGKGPAMLINIPAPGFESADGLLGAGRTYKTLLAGGYPAILERDRFLGLSLAVCAPGVTLTIETPADISDDDIVELASALLSLM